MVLTRSMLRLQRLRIAHGSAALVCAGVLLALCTGPAFNQEQAGSQILERDISSAHFTDTTIVDAASRALMTAAVPGGIATASFCQPAAHFDLAPRGGLLRNLLESIVAAEPSYRWTVDQDVVNLSQVYSRRTLLDKNIANLSIDDPQNVDNVIAALISAPEIQDASAEMGLKRGRGEIGMKSIARPGALPERKVPSLVLHDLTLQEALNAIARQRGTAVWFYNQRDCAGNKDFSISFVVW